MSDKVLSSLLTVVVLGALAVWVPLLESIAWFRRRQPLRLAVSEHAGAYRNKSSALGNAQVIP